jgi:EpsD family peptidyl-prolyl cis-trans isomerase
VAAALIASTALGGCDQIKKLAGGGKPAGQVVATVNGDEITTTELRAEMGNFASRDPAVMKAAQQQALQQIIMRDLLTQKAKEAKLDKSPQYTLQVRRGEQTLLAQLYERKLAAAVATPSRDEAETYVASHPGMFAQHRVLLVSQVIANPAGKIKPDQFKSLKTLDDIKALFDAQGIPYRENSAVLDTLTANPRLLEQVDKLPPGEVFVLPQNGAITFNRVDQSRSLPIRGDMAVNYAINLLKNQKAQDLVRTQMIAMRTAADKSITYNPAYKPDKPFTPPPAPGATPAAGEAPAASGAAAPATPAEPAAPATK